MNITEQHKIKITEIAQKYELSLVLLFGSQARGKTHPQSDVDVGFFSDHSMGLREIAQLEFEMSQTLQIGSLELVRLNGMSSLFLKNVLDDGILLYERAPGDYTSFAGIVFKRFVEEKPLRELRKSALEALSTAV